MPHTVPKGISDGFYGSVGIVLHPNETSQYIPWRVIYLAWDSVPGRNISRDPMGYVGLVRLLVKDAWRIMAFR